MKDTHRMIAALCRTPQPMEAIQAHVGVTKAVIYLLVQRGLLRNTGTKARGLFEVVEGVSVEAERTFDVPRQIVQASSVWDYARRLGAQQGRAA